jgi:outer membrane protein
MRSIRIDLGHIESVSRRCCSCLAISHAVAVSADVPVDSGTYLTVGPGIYVQPTYPGASGSRGFFLPYIDAEYHNWLYSNAADLIGVYAYKTPTTQLGGAIQYDFTERLNKDDPRFQFLRDVRATPRFKLFASHTIGLITGDVNVATDIAGRDQGTLAQANLSLAIPFVPKFFFSVGPGLTWASSTYMQSFFGITPGQSQVSQLPAYDARRRHRRSAHQRASRTIRFPSAGASERRPYWARSARRRRRQSDHAAVAASSR